MEEDERRRRRSSPPPLPPRLVSEKFDSAKEDKEEKEDKAEKATLDRACCSSGAGRKNGEGG